MNATTNTYPEESVPVNMFFSTNDIKNKVIPKEDKSTSYIIFQNNELHTKLQNLQKEMNEVNEEKTEMENEISSLTRARTCLQGYVKNEFELATNWKFMASSYKDHLIKFEKAWVISCLFNLLFMVLLSMIGSFSLRITVVSLYIPTTFTLTAMRIHNLHKGWSTNEKNKETLEKIEKIDKSNVYIQELVDNI